MECKINRNLIPICVIFFLLNIGVWFTTNYMVLLLRSKGLTLVDAGIINGCLPWFAFFSSPLMGYVGDKFGLKLVLSSSLVGLMLTSAALNLVPVHRTLHAVVGIDEDFYNNTITF